MLDTRRTLINSLKVNSEILEIIQSDFVKMLYSGDFYVHSFQEGRPINLKFGKVHTFRCISFDCNYVELLNGYYLGCGRFLFAI
jgi:hypothetical protein